MCPKDLGQAPDGRRARGETRTQPGAVLTAEEGHAGKGGPEKVGCLVVFSYSHYKISLVDICFYFLSLWYEFLN